jgi:putative peptide zinc metalloprotease protein
MNDKAKPELELLIRASGSRPGSSGSFITKRYVANQVALTVRPKRIPDDSFEMQAQSRNDSKVAYVIRHLESDRYLFLNEEEYFLWQKMDGMHTLRDVATAYFVKFGSFDFSKIQRFLERARQDKLIIIPETDLMRRSLTDVTTSTSWFGKLKVRLFAIDWRMSNVDERIGTLYRKIDFLFSRPARVLYVLLFVGGCAALYDHFSLNLPSVEWLYRLALSPLLLLLIGGTFVLHELAHALACKHYGREVKAFGFAFMNRMIPSVYADVTDIWMSTRSARIAVSFAGPASGMVIASIAAIGARFLPFPTASGFLWTYALAIMVASASSLYPCLFLESDGYHILSDWLRMPALREHGRRLLRQRLLPRKKGKVTKKRPLTSDERIYFAYGIASIGSIVAIVAATIILVALQF